MADSSTEELDELSRALYAEAQHVAAMAYAPYSGFSVGAAVRADDGRVFLGANVENASFSLTICAERSAIAAAVSAGVRKLDAIAVHVDGENGEPCGACRQVMQEFGIGDVVLVRDGRPVMRHLDALLPEPFDGRSLGQ